MIMVRENVLACPFQNAFSRSWLMMVLCVVEASEQASFSEILFVKSEVGVRLYPRTVGMDLYFYMGVTRLTGL